MILGTQTVANPVQIIVMPFSVVAANLTMAGVKTQKLLRFWGSDVFPAGQPIRGYRFRLSWINISKTEMDVLEAAYAEACAGYVPLTTHDLAVTFNGAANTYFVTVDPQEPALKATWNQGYAMNEDLTIDPVPVAYDAELQLIATTYWDLA